MRLEELGLAKYISPNLKEEEYYQLFNENVQEALNTPLSKKNEGQSALTSTKEEIQKRQNEFDFEQIIKELVQEFKKV